MTDTVFQRSASTRAKPAEGIRRSNARCVVSQACPGADIAPLERKEN
jgi:hypothetical protein